MNEKVVRITIELDSDTYRRLIEKAESEGYSVLNDYILYLIKKSIAETINVNVEYVFSKLKNRITRIVQDEFNKYSSIITEIRNQLADVYEKIDSLNKTIEELKKSEKTSLKTKAGRKTGIDRLREEKVVFESNLPRYIQSDRFFNYLEREGAIVLRLKERVAVDPDYWSLFKKILFEEISSDNDDEIREKLGKTGYDLFLKIRDEALIYYDPKRRKWFPSSKDFFK
uniref:CopG family transcriptional regulator n=1 Tax=Staphylothermus marinus TaxID=2280 RepID=A0A7C4D7Z9_STAMA